MIIELREDVMATLFFQTTNNPGLHFESKPIDDGVRNLAKLDTAEMSSGSRKREMDPSIIGRASRHTLRLSKKLCLDGR